MRRSASGKVKIYINIAIAIGKKKKQITRLVENKPTFVHISATQP